MLGRNERQLVNHSTHPLPSGSAYVPIFFFFSYQVPFRATRGNPSVYQNLAFSKHNGMIYPWKLAYRLMGVSSTV